MKTVLLALIIGSFLFATSYLYQQSQISAEDAFLASLPSSLPHTAFWFHRIQPAPSPIGNVLFFTWKSLESDTAEEAYVPVKRNLFGQWIVGNSGRCNQPGATKSSISFADLHAHSLWLPYDYNSMTDFSVVCGRARQADAAKATVRWQDNTETSTRLQGIHFILFHEGRVAACEISFFDQTDTRIGQIDLRKLTFTSGDATTPLPLCD